MTSSRNSAVRLCLRVGWRALLSLSVVPVVVLLIQVGLGFALMDRDIILYIGDREASQYLSMAAGQVCLILVIPTLLAACATVWITHASTASVNWHRKALAACLICCFVFEWFLLFAFDFIFALYSDPLSPSPDDHTVASVTAATPMILNPFYLPILWMVDNSMGLTPILLFCALWGLGLTLVGYAAWHLFCRTLWRRRQRDALPRE